MTAYPVSFFSKTPVEPWVIHHFSRLINQKIGLADSVRYFWFKIGEHVVSALEHALETRLIATSNKQRVLSSSALRLANKTASFDTCEAKIMIL